MRINQKQRGFTLIELVLVILLVGVISVSITKIFAQILLLSLAGQNATDALAQGRLGMERMVKEIHTTRSAVDISIFTSSEYSFTDMNGNAIDFQLSGGNLVRNNVVLAEGVNSLTFYYVDKNASLTATAANISYIQINMNVTQSNSDFTLTTGVYLRDLSS